MILADIGDTKDVCIYVFDGGNYVNWLNIHQVSPKTPGIAKAPRIVNTFLVRLGSTDYLEKISSKNSQYFPDGFDLWNI